MNTIRRWFYQNRSVRTGPWGGGAGAVQALNGTSSWYHEQFKLPEHNVFMCMGLEAEDGHPSAEQLLELARAQSRPTRVFIRINDCDARKGTQGVDDRIINVANQCDGVIFVSQWMRDYFTSKSSWKNENTKVIINGVDHSVFFPCDEKSSNGRIRIVSHHWSDNPFKANEGTKLIDEFVGQNPDRFSFTFIGRTKLHLPNSTIIPPLSGQPLAQAIAKNDVYYSESISDPGPNSVLEAIACGLPTYVSPMGGGAVEFAGADHAVDTAQFIELLKRGEFTPNAFRPQWWRKFALDVLNFVSQG